MFFFFWNWLALEVFDLVHISYIEKKLALFSHDWFLFQISIGMVQLEALFEPLLDLCILKNVSWWTNSFFLFFWGFVQQWESHRRCFSNINFKILMNNSVLLYGIEYVES